MNKLIPLLLLGGAVYTFPAQGCTGAKAMTSDPAGFVAVNLTEAVLTTDNAPAPNPNKVPRAQCTQCNGTGRITHGDGHQTECPHCYAFFGPVPLEQLTYVDFRVPLTKTASLECDCEKCDCAPCICDSPLIKPASLKDCGSGSCGTQGGGSCSTGPSGDAPAGDCASGACGSGAGSGNPRFTGPVRRIGGFFRERRPVRRFLGRLFGRR